MTIGERILFVFVMNALRLTLVGVPIFVFMDGIQKFALKPPQRRVIGPDLDDSLRAGDVWLVYHTY